MVYNQGNKEMPNPTPTKEDLKSLAKESRLKVLDLVYKAQTSHIGSLMGAADLFAVIFSKINLDEDKFILSAGWKAALLYFHLWKKGRITLDELDSYCLEDSKFIGLAEPIHSDIPFAGGSMGYGLPAAVGFALAKKLNKEPGTIYCYMSDGELAIGTTWEAVLIAVQHKLDNLVVIVERNGFQAMGKTEDILKGYFPSKGWDVEAVMGHGFEGLVDMFGRIEENGKPACIVTNTIKGKGVSFMENNNLYHYKALSPKEYEDAKQELQSNHG